MAGMGFLSGALQGFGSSTNDLLDTALKIKAMKDLNDYRQLHGQLWQAQMAGNLAKQEKEQQALQAIQGISGTQEVPVTAPVDQSAIQAEAATGGYAPPPVQTMQTVTLAPHERYAKVAERLMPINPEMALKFQTKADEERNKIVAAKNTAINQTLNALEKRGDMESINKYFAQVAKDPDVGKFYPQGPVAERGKEFNIPGNLDVYLATVAGKLGVDYNTPEGRAKTLNEYSRNPSVQQGFVQWSHNIAPPMFNIQPTAGGLVPFNVRTGQPGTPTGIGKPLSNEMITAAQQIGTLKETLDRAKTLYRPDYVGPIAGRTSGVREAIGVGPLSIKPEQTQFNSEVAQLGNTLIYLMSGKQINEQEYKRLKAQLPDKNLPPKNFQARMDEFERTMNSIIQNREKNMGGYGPNPIKGQPVVIDNPNTVNDMKNAGIPVPQGAKVVVKKFVSPSTGKTKYVYSDGTEEIR